MGIDDCSRLAHKVMSDEAGPRMSVLTFRGGSLRRARRHHFTRDVRPDDDRVIQCGKSVAASCAGSGLKQRRTWPYRPRTNKGKANRFMQCVLRDRALVQALISRDPGRSAANPQSQPRPRQPEAIR